MSIILILAALVAVSIEALPVENEEGGTKLWGEWSEWSDCSRSCDSGVTSQHRSCLNCEGTEEVMETRFKSCCTEDCPGGSVDFRQYQCQLMGSLNGKNWTLAEADDEGCTLACEDTGFFPVRTRSGMAVPPGTPCKTESEGSKGVCIGRQCVIVGCDGVLGSQDKEDKCLQCGTGGEEEERSLTCQSYMETLLPFVHTNGSVDILNIPKSSTSLNISHHFKDSSDGTMAIKSSIIGEHFFRVGENGSMFEAAETMFLYHVYKDGEGFREEFTARGPLSHPLVVELRREDGGMGGRKMDNVSLDPAPHTVDYIYYNLKDQENKHYIPPSSHHHGNHTKETLEEGDDQSQYRFEYMPPSECSVRCGRGIQTSLPMCVDPDFSEREVVDEICIVNGYEKPLPLVQPCQIQKCLPYWQSGGWSSCSQECGPGKRLRNVGLYRFEEEGRKPVAVVDTALYTRSKPAQEEQCNIRNCSANWISGVWTECSDGIQYRSVECHEVGDDVSPTPRRLSRCNTNTRPITVRKCSNCEDNGEGERCCSWVQRKWKKCNNSCGYGVKSRNVFCRYQEGNKYANESCCAGLVKPASQEPCWDTRMARCLPEWKEGNYTGQCKSSCAGDQSQHRNVSCVVTPVSGGVEVKLPDEACIEDGAKPDHIQECTQWMRSEWGACPVGCGPRKLQMRSVVCATCRGAAKEEESCHEVKPTESRWCEEVTCAPPTTPPSCLDRGDWCKDLVQQCSNSYYRQVCCETCRGEGAAVTPLPIT